MFTWIENIYNYFSGFTNNSLDSEFSDKDETRRKKIRESLEIGDFDKDLIDKIINLKKIKQKN